MKVTDVGVVSCSLEDYLIHKIDKDMRKKKRRKRRRRDKKRKSVKKR